MCCTKYFRYPILIGWCDVLSNFYVELGFLSHNLKDIVVLQLNRFPIYVIRRKEVNTIFFNLFMLGTDSPMFAVGRRKLLAMSSICLWSVYQYFDQILLSFQCLLLDLFSGRREETLAWYAIHDANIFFFLREWMVMNVILHWICCNDTSFG